MIHDCILILRTFAPLWAPIFIVLAMYLSYEAITAAEEPK